MCRDILNSCVRNTEEAERTSQTKSGHGNAGRGSETSAGGGGSGRGLGKGVWNMIEESELAKSIRLDEENKVSFFTSTIPFDRCKEPLLINTCLILITDRSGHRFPGPSVYHTAL
jgi:hypothetical protein